jgi:hypothetical protein
MNQPDRYSRFVLPSGVDAAVEYKPDTKMRAAGQFNIWLEDHTVGNLLRHQLLSNPEVRRCGWCLWLRRLGLAVVYTVGGKWLHAVSIRRCVIVVHANGRHSRRAVVCLLLCCLDGTRRLWQQLW